MITPPALNKGRRRFDKSKFGASRRRDQKESGGEGGWRRTDSNVASAKPRCAPGQSARDRLINDCPRVAAAFRSITIDLGPHCVRVSCRGPGSPWRLLHHPTDDRTTPVGQAAGVSRVRPAGRRRHDGDPRPRAACARTPHLFRSARTPTIASGLFHAPARGQPLAASRTYCAIVRAANPRCDLAFFSAGGNSALVRPTSGSSSRGS